LENWPRPFQQALGDGRNSGSIPPSCGGTSALWREKTAAAPRLAHIDIPNERANIAKPFSHSSGAQNNKAALKTTGTTIRTTKTVPVPMFFTLAQEHRREGLAAANLGVTVCEVSHHRGTGTEGSSCFEQPLDCNTALREWRNLCHLTVAKGRATLFFCKITPDRALVSELLSVNSSFVSLFSYTFRVRTLFFNIFSCFRPGKPLVRVSASRRNSPVEILHPS
jgi:hypothetical protein